MLNKEWLDRKFVTEKLRDNMRNNRLFACNTCMDEENILTELFISDSDGLLHCPKHGTDVGGSRSG